MIFCIMRRPCLINKCESVEETERASLRSCILFLLLVGRADLFSTQIHFIRDRDRAAIATATEVIPVRLDNSAEQN